MRIVAVSQRVDRFSDRNEVRDALDQRLIKFLVTAGCIPVPVPNVLCRRECEDQDRVRLLDAWLSKLNPKAFVLSGGNNLGEFECRDFTEMHLLDHASKLHAPVLGLCRGMQVIANYAGIGIHPLNGHVCTQHIIHGKIKQKVNSYHSFSIDRCPDEYEILAKSEDGEIEAIRHKSLPWEGWMWHPERENDFEESDLLRLQELFA